MKKNSIRPALLTVILITACFNPMQAQETQKNSRPCSDPKYHQFDFWLGEWNVTRAGGDTATPAKSKISRILNECVILEEYETPKGYSGKSFNTFDSANDQWQQFWIDNEGGILHFTGKLEDGAMKFFSRGKDAAGKETLTRMTFSALEGNTVHQFIEESKDNGKTWTVAFDGIYTRRP
jgi:hypothetical protein